MRKIVLIASFAAALSACTWVHLDPAAQNVKVIAAGAAPACEKKGEVNVSVKNSVGLYNRKALKVRDELETLARNEAPTLKADTIQPLQEPFDGTQRFAAYRCGK